MIKLIIIIERVENEIHTTIATDGVQRCTKSERLLAEKMLEAVKSLAGTMTSGAEYSREIPPDVPRSGA